jgi:hydrogenase expression/formation protein HypE
VVVVAGDTKVVPRGEGSGVTFATTGIGIRPSSLRLSIDRIEVGDQLLVSGSVGDHGTSVLLARESFGLRGNLSSDSASIFPLAEIAVAVDGLRFMRDPTRGGVATVANEIARRRGAGVVLREADIPLNDEVRSVCEILGYDPLYLACEGRVVAVARPDAAREILSRWQNHEQGRGAAIIGTVVDLHHGEVALLTPLGGERLLHELEDDPLPRIC